ncbi:MAG: cysteine desulfurase, partial [Paracoccaceae bacterium]|nr:cysteine desulfurase [Paracoccaceae bacterium]
WLSTAPMFAHDTKTGDITPSPADARFAQAAGFQDVVRIVQGRCSMCHAKEPGYPGILWAPKGVRLETPAEIAHNAERIYIQAGVTHAMPPANLSFIEPSERAEIRKWFRSAEGKGA